MCPSKVSDFPKFVPNFFFLKMGLFYSKIRAPSLRERFLPTADNTLSLNSFKISTIDLFVQKVFEIHSASEIEL